MKKLWTKNFTIITLGTVVSMVGSTVSDFALGLVIFEKTNSPFLYALFFVAVLMPNVIVPLIAGPFVDRFSRRKMIYSLDFLFFGLFSAFALLAYFDIFNYFLYLFLGVISGIIFAFYNVAYESFYPTLISEGNYSKAYSMSSMLWPLAHTIMVPIAAIAYEKVGLFPLFLINAISFFIAAVAETQIDIEESQTIRESEDVFNFKKEFKEGIVYLKEEKGLLSVTKYFCVTMFAAGVVETLLLPFFKSTPSLGVSKYAIVMSSQSLGRLIGGIVHYRIKYPKNQKFRIAVVVYTVISCLDCLFFFSPYKVMLLIYLVYGLLGVTSFSIRVSSTQSYVPNDKRGRFNGIFAVITMFGMMMGQLLGGILGEFMYIPFIIMVTSALGLLFVYIFIVRNKEEIKILYNRDV